MADIKDYVSVTVTRGTRPIDTAGFGTPMFLGLINFYGAAERTRTYSDVTSMTNDGFPTNHPAVVWATDVFAGVQQPASVVIGKQTYTSIDVTPTVVSDTDYTVTVATGGATQTVTITSDATATATEIVDALVAAIDDATIVANATIANVADVLVITPNALKEVAVTTTDTNLAVAYNTPEDVDVSLAAIASETDSWFFLAGQSQADADISKFAAFAEANDKMFFVSVPVSTVGAAGSSDIASTLQTNQYANTQTITVDDSRLDEYASGALIGAMAATNPGTSTWFAKTLTGITAENFSGTQETFIQSKNSNFYPLVAGVGFYTDGKQANGDFADVIRFSLWLKARIAESVFGLMKRKSDLGLKIPHTDEGYGMIAEAIYGDVISVGVSRGAIATLAEGAPNPVIRMPKREDVPVNDRAARILPDVEVELTYSGAVQDVVVKVYLQV